MTRKGLALLSVLIWAGLFVLPVAALMVECSHGLLEMGSAAYSLLWSKVGFTAWQASVSSILSGVLGLLWGLPLARYPRAQAWLRVPFGVPTLAAVAAWASLLSGTWIEYSAWAVIVAHVAFNVPWVALAVAQASASVPQVWSECARTLGAGWLHRLRAVVWPVIGPAWLGAMAQVFSFCASSFVIVMVLGGGPPVETLETAIYSSVRTGILDLGMATRLAVCQLILSLLPWWAVRIFFGRTQLRAQKLGALPGGIREPAFAPAVASLWAGVWVLPYVFFLKDLRWPESGWGVFWSALHFPIFVSIGIAACVSFFSVVWAGASVVLIHGSGLRVWVEALLLLPSGVSTLTLCMGFWLAYSRWVDPFEGSLVALIAIQTVVFFPLVFRSFLPLARASPVRLWELARSHGATPWQAFWSVEWPRWRAPVWSSLAMVSAASLGEVAAVGFFGSEKLVTVSGLVARWMGSYRFEQAGILVAVILGVSMVLSLLPTVAKWDRA